MLSASGRPKKGYSLPSHPRTPGMAWWRVVARHPKKKSQWRSMSEKRAETPCPPTDHGSSNESYAWRSADSTSVATCCDMK